MNFTGYFLHPKAYEYYVIMIKNNGENISNLQEK